MRRGKRYDNGLRAKICARIAGGEAIGEIANAEGIPARTIERWWDRFQLTGSSSWKPKPSPNAQWDEVILKWVRTDPEITLAELQGRLAQSGVKSGSASIWRRLKANGLTGRTKKEKATRAEKPMETVARGRVRRGRRLIEQLAEVRDHIEILKGAALNLVERIRVQIENEAQDALSAIEKRRETLRMK